MSTRSRRHHYLPRLYLKWFAASPSKNARIHSFDLRERKHFTPSIADIGVVRDFNTVEIDGEQRDDVESFFAQIETEVARSVRSVIEDPAAFTEIDKEWVAWLITCIGIRNPRLRGTIAKAFEELSIHIAELISATPERYAQVLRGIERDQGKPSNGVTYEQFRDFIKRREFTVSMGNNFHVGQELRMLEEIHGLLMRRNWRFLTAEPETGGFVCTDHPVALVWSDPTIRRPLNAGPGYGSMGSTVYFPLSPQLLLEGRFEAFDEPGDRIQLVTEGVAIANNNLISYADRQVYAPHKRFIFMVRKSGSWSMSTGHRLLDDWPAGND